MINANSLLQKTENLYSLPLSDGMVFLEPSGGGFLKLERDLIPLFSGLSRPLSFEQLKNLSPLSAPALQEWLERLYQHGLLKINGRQAASCPAQEKPPLLFILELPPADRRQDCIRTVKSHLAETGERKFSLLITGPEPMEDLNFLKELPAALSPIQPGKLTIATRRADFTSEEKDFLRQNGVRLLVELDLNRPLGDLRRSGINFAGVFRPRSPRELKPALEYCLAQDLCQVKFALRPQDGVIGPEFAQAYLELLPLLTEHYQNTGSPLHLYDLKHWVSALCGGARPYPCHRSPCGAGENLCFLSGDLKIYSCPRERELAFMPPEGGEEKAAPPAGEALPNRSLSALPRCRLCPFRSFCAGGCPQRANSAYGQIFREDPACAFYQKIFAGLLAELAQSSLPALSLGVKIK